MTASRRGRIGFGSLILGAMFWVGCDNADEVAIDDFGEEAARTVCDKAYDCCQPMELMEHMDYKGGREACYEKSKKSLGFWAAIIKKEEERGRLSYSPELARNCLRAYAVTTCDMHKRNVVLDACNGFVKPMTAPGAACQAGESCQGGACNGVTEGTEGVCRAHGTEGASCMSAPCAKGLYCDAGSKICKATKPDGASCNLHSECQSAGCNGRNAEAGTPGTCGLKGGEGSSCFVTTGCSYAPGGRGAGGFGFLALGLLGVVAATRAGRRRRR